MSDRLSTPVVHFMIASLLECLAVPPGQTEDDRQIQHEALIAALVTLAPRNPYEALLAARIVAAHNGSMDCLHRAALPGLSDSIVLRYLARATSMSQMAERLSVTLAKSRKVVGTPMDAEGDTAAADQAPLVPEVVPAQPPAAPSPAARPAAPTPAVAEVAPPERSSAGPQVLSRQPRSDPGPAIARQPAAVGSLDLRAASPLDGVLGAGLPRNRDGLLASTALPATGRAAVWEGRLTQ